MSGCLKRQKSADPSSVERVGENENANYPIPTTKYQYQLPDTQYPNTLMPNTENIKMPKYLMIQNIKIPGCGRGPIALADGSNILGHCLGRSQWPLAVGLRRSLWPKQHPNARAMAWGLGPWPALRAMPPRLMAISLEPWPKILDIRGCAWGKPVGRELPLNPRLEDAKFKLTLWD